jgi:hypothetical protein
MISGEQRQLSPPGKSATRDHAKLVLEQLDVPAERRLRRPKPVRRLADTPSSATARNVRNCLRSIGCPRCFISGEHHMR